MYSRGPFRHHAPRFKLQLCEDIRSGVLTRRDAQRMYNLSANLIQLWLTLFDRVGTEAAGQYAGRRLAGDVVGPAETHRGDIRSGL